MRKRNTRQPKLPSESVMADLCLGIAVAGVNTLIGMGLIIAFVPAVLGP
jgi:hypothetical protein